MSADAAESLVPDDRVLKVTKAVSVAIVPVLTAAFVILFLFPGQTTALWSWTIKSRMSAMFMGGGYLAGALFFFRAWRATEWHRLGPGIIATTGFATLLGIATFVNWDQFVTKTGLLTGPLVDVPRKPTVFVPTASIGFEPRSTSSTYTPGER